jgi:molecular chaperone GrpE (heat shock protein)
MDGGGNPASIMSVDTNTIRRSLLKITQKHTDKRMAKLADDVLSLCDAYDEVTNLSAVIEAGNESLRQSFDMLESLRKSL